MSLQSIRLWLKKRLVNGFWFPVLTAGLDRAYKILPGTLFGRWLSDVRGAPELYSFAWLAVLLTWLAVVRWPVHRIFTAPVFVWAATIVLLVRATEILLFALHWVFAARAPIESTRRSLAAFLFNVVEVAGLFAVLQVLAGGADSPWRTTWEGLVANFSLETVQHPRGVSWRRFLAYYQILLGGLLLTVVVASLVGGVLRQERDSASRHAG